MHTFPPAEPNATPTGPGRSPPRVLITAGPTHEPIDAVRFIGNRSSGKLGVLLADETARRGWPTRLLLGPTCTQPTDPLVETERFITCGDLSQLLHRHQPWCDLLIMAAAVADFRPLKDQTYRDGKIRRSDQALTLQLEPTEDLLAACSERRSNDQILIGFALEPLDTMLASAEQKLVRKRVDGIVANPLQTMDANSIEAVLVLANGRHAPTPGAISKDMFASWLVHQLQEAFHALQTS